MKSPPRGPGPKRLAAANYLIYAPGWSPPIYESLEPSIQNPAAILAVMLSTPAVLQSLVASVPGRAWPRKPIADEWALVEVICHLRDTEREIHQMQINTLLDGNEPFIPRPIARCGPRNGII